MDAYMLIEDDDKVKAISVALNTSFSIEELQVNLDLEGMSLQEAERCYTEAMHDAIDYIDVKWFHDGTSLLSFKSMLDAKTSSPKIIFPCKAKREVDPNDLRTKLYLMVCKDINSKNIGMCIPIDMILGLKKDGINAVTTMLETI